MVDINKEIIGSDIEKKILTALITSDEFCKQIHKIVKGEYFKSDYAKVIFRWIDDFYNRYKECPGKCIQDIYLVEKDKLKKADADIVAFFLNNLSQEYEKESINYGYLIDQAKMYFKERSLLILSELIAGNVIRGKLQKA
jgi:hypothetical protein